MKGLRRREGSNILLGSELNAKSIPCMEGRERERVGEPSNTMTISTSVRATGEKVTKCRANIVNPKDSENITHGELGKLRVNSEQQHMLAVCRDTGAWIFKE